MTVTSLTVVLLSGLLSLLAVGLIKQRFSQYLLDIPNDRSSHTQPTPRGGGLGFIVAFAITSAICAYLPIIGTAPIVSISLWWLVLIPLIAVGIIDDRSGVAAGIRYLIQLSAASLTVFYFGSFPQPWLNSFGITGNVIAIVLTVIGMTAFINFYNFMDGLDGLVAGVSAVQLGFIALWFNLPFLWLLIAALLGFLYWNWSPAKIFMGDAGSTVLGATVAIALLNNNNPVQAWSALAIILPLVADAIYTLIRRLIRRENIFKAHRSHLYQRLQQSGWSHAQVASAYIGMTLLVGGFISIFSLTGAGISLIGIVAAIALGEFYLRSRNQLQSEIRA